MSGEPGHCEICGKEYVKRSRRSHVCSAECGHEYLNRRMREYMRSYYWRVQRPKRLLEKAAKEEADTKETPRPKRKSRRSVRICIICGRDFTSQSSRVKCCGPECQAVRKRWLELIYNARRARKRRKTALVEAETEQMCQ